MRSTRLLAWLAVGLAGVMNGSFAGASAGQRLELNLQRVPEIRITGAAGWVRIESTTNLEETRGWSPLATVPATNSPYFYADASATNVPARFYRAALVNGGDTNEPALNPDPQHWVWINAGTFMMGSPESDGDRYSDEDPQTRVTFTQGFWMSKYETTQEEYLTVMGDNPSYFTGDLKRPVEQVSWDDANDYCAALTARERAAGRLPTGYVYRLPTEAEWEYCCRAGTTTRFSYGDDVQYLQLRNYAWSITNSGGTTHPVGLRRPNPWGVYDMLGNVWEWCLDWYEIYPGGSVTDPRGPTTGSARVIRGGGWGYTDWFCRTASRDYDWSGLRNFYMGFRPVLAFGQ